MKNGPICDFRYSARGRLFRNDTGKALTISGVIWDITERKQADELIFRLNERLTLATASAKAGVWDWNLLTNEMIWDDRMLELYGMTRENFPGGVEAWKQGLHPDDASRAIEDCQAALRGERPFDTEFRVRWTDGTVLHIKAHGLVTRDEKGNPIRMIGLNTDISKQKQAEERQKEMQAKLEQATRMESLGVLAGGVAHDLNNVLGPLVLLPDLVTEYVERHGDAADPEHTETLDAIQTLKTSAQRAVAVVSDLVVMGRRGQFQKAPVDVNRVVDLLLDSKQIRNMQAMRPDVQVSKALSNDPLWCLGSESRLVRVLANLVGNAAEAITGQGDVRVLTGEQVLQTPYPGYEQVPAGHYIVIQVVDTGCGMDARTITRIFEPFFSTKAPSERSGSGLGLSVVYGLVKDHAGFLDLKSTPGKGTTFTLYLPAIAPGERQSEHGPAILPRGSERILVVDDEPAQQSLARRQLTRLGYDTTVVSSGEEAVALFKTTRQAGQPAPFDLVMADVIMKGMDGLDTCRTILDLYPEMKLIISSGHAPDGYEEPIEAIGADWLHKPYTAIDLATAIRTRLGRP